MPRGQLELIEAPSEAQVIDGANAPRDAKKLTEAQWNDRASEWRRGTTITHRLIPGASLVVLMRGL
jgi:hypothetical protein